MDVTISARHGTVSAGIRRHAVDRLRRLERFERRPARAQVFFDAQRGAKKVEAHLTVMGGGLFIAHAAAPSYRNALDRALERLTRQIQRYRKRDRNHQAPKIAQ
jgi:ribosomal subunit interface protein